MTTRADLRPRFDRGLNRQLLPMRLWEKAKVHGVWNPASIDFGVDRAQWVELPTDFRARLLQVCAAFRAGEEAVSAEILPLLRVVSSERRIEEEVFLTSFIWDEARHVDLFQRLFAEICPEVDPEACRPADVYRRLFEEELRPAFERLWVDASPIALVRASVTYHLVVEGVLAETGYYIFRKILGRTRLPGTGHAMLLLQRDESRHIAFGLYFLSRLMVEHGDVALRAFLTRVNELAPLVSEATDDLARAFEGHETAVTASELVRVSRQAFMRRVQHIARARTQTAAQLHAAGAFDVDDEG